MVTHVGPLVGGPAHGPCEQIDGDTSYESSWDQEGDTVQSTVPKPFDDSRSESCDGAITYLLLAIARRRVTHVDCTGHKEIDIRLNIHYRFFDLIDL
jgi:hypothetical protein